MVQRIITSSCFNQAQILFLAHGGHGFLFEYFLRINYMTVLSLASTKTCGGMAERLIAVVLKTI